MIEWKSEAEQVAALLAHLGPGAIDTRDSYLCGGRAPDAIQMIGWVIHSYECKLKNWKQAGIQALDHQLVVDRAWIVIPNPKPKWVEGTGIGLMDGYSFEVVVPAGPADGPWPFEPWRTKYMVRYWPGRERKDHA